MLLIVHVSVCTDTIRRTCYCLAGNVKQHKVTGWSCAAQGPASCLFSYCCCCVVLCGVLQGHGRPSSHRPELVLNNFNTRLGRRVGRMLGSLFHQEPQFRGRRVATFHNQRDFIFFR